MFDGQGSQLDLELVVLRLYVHGADDVVDGQSQLHGLRGYHQGQPTHHPLEPVERLQVYSWNSYLVIYYCVLYQMYGCGRGERSK